MANYDKVKAFIRNNVICQRRSLEGKYLWIANTIGGAIALFYFYTAFTGIFSIESHRGVFFGGTLALVFLWFPATGKSPYKKFTLFDVLLALAALVLAGYFVYSFPIFAERPGIILPHEIWMAWAAIILSLEGARRAVGIVLPLISFLILLYTFPAISQELPDLIAHRGIGIERTARFLYTSADGLFGSVTNVMATFVVPFVIFGAFLEKSGAANFFIQLPYSLLGRTASGSALVAVIGSCLVGSVVGSPLANVVATGTFTIPLMKKSGYHPDDAAAIEAAVSSGSMFMPPVMGAAVFLMVEFTGIAYIEIVRVALIPALLFFLGIAVMVILQANKMGIKGHSGDDFPDTWDVFKKGWSYLLPLVVLAWVLVEGYSAHRAAFFGSIACVVVSLFRKETRMGIKDLWETFVIAGKNVLGIAAVAGAIGIIVGVLTLTGLGLRFSSIVIAVAGGNLLFTIILIAIAATILGMGTNIAAVYAILAMIAPAALQELGVSLMASHMLLIWYSQLSGITPPVCVVAYAAAAISGGNPFYTGIKALKYGILLIILPLLFVYTPLLLEGTVMENVIAVITATIGVVGIAIFMQNYFLRLLTVFERVLMLAGSVMLLFHNYFFNAVGIVLVALVIAVHIIGSNQKVRVKA